MSWFTEIYEVTQKDVTITVNGKEETVSIKSESEVSNLTQEQAILVIKNPDVFSAIKTNLAKLDNWPSGNTFPANLVNAGTVLRMFGGGAILDKIKDVTTSNIDQFFTWLQGSDGKKLIQSWDKFKTKPKGTTDKTACPVMVALFKKAIGM